MLKNKESQIDRIQGLAGTYKAWFIQQFERHSAVAHCTTFMFGRDGQDDRLIHLDSSNFCQFSSWYMTSVACQTTNSEA